jgi:hypothetical protein
LGEEVRRGEVLGIVLPDPKSWPSLIFRSTPESFKTQITRHDA